LFAQHIGSKNTVFWDVFTAMSMIDVFGILYCVVLVITDVSEENTASTFRVTRILTLPKRRLSLIPPGNIAEESFL
jgi:hypothetical protein